MNSHPNQTDNNEENYLTYSDQLKDDQYVSQFLNIFGSIKIQENMENFAPVQAPLPVISDMEQVQQSDREQKKKRSCFHNFQKHLVTTIKFLIDPSLFPKHKNKKLKECQQSLWNCFCSSPKQNKTLASLLFDDLNKVSAKQLEVYRFSSIKQKFIPQMILEAQSYLRKSCIAQLQTSMQTGLITNRRIVYKQEFELYFQLFLQGLKEGDFSKRISGLRKSLNERRQKLVKIEEDNIV